jgi:hypothetical protein
MAGHVIKPKMKRLVQNAALSGDNQHAIIFSEMVETGEASLA